MISRIDFHYAHLIWKRFVEWRGFATFRLLISTGHTPDSWSLPPIGAMIIVYIVLASLAIWIVFRIQYHKRERKQYKAAFADSFKNIEPAPLLRIRNSYGFPSFEVTFRSKNLLEQAEKNGLTKSFVERISQIHSNFKEFDADRAIYFTWEGRTYTIVTPPQ